MPMKKEIHFEPGYDKRSTGHGIHGMCIRFLLIGEKGVIQFLISTDWFPESVDRNKLTGLNDLYPIPTDIGYHSLTPIYEGQKTYGECMYFDGRVCYYDDSRLQAIEVYKLLLRDGHEGVWKVLTEKYESLFGKEEVCK